MSKEKIPDDNRYFVDNSHGTCHIKVIGNICDMEKLEAAKAEIKELVSEEKYKDLLIHDIFVDEPIKITRR